MKFLKTFWDQNKKTLTKTTNANALHYTFMIFYYKEYETQIENYSSGILFWTRSLKSHQKQQFGNTFEYSLLALEPLQAQNHYDAARGRFIRPFF